MGKVEELTKKLKNYLATNEKVLYVAETSVLKDAVFPPQVIVTSNRLIVRVPKMIGQQLEDYPFDKIQNIQIEESLLFSSLVIKALGSERRVEGLSKKEAQEVMKFARESQTR